MSLLPQFELKQSYIVKNKINYDIKRDGDFIYEEYGILFTDYDLARKTQIFNTNHFSGFTLSNYPFNYTRFDITQYDKSFYIDVTNKSFEFEEIYNIGDIVNTYEYTEIKFLNTATTDIFDIDDYIEISFYTKQTVNGTATWEHVGAIGETWFVDGYTSNYTYWSVTGLTTVYGSSSGITNWSVSEKNPIFKYKAIIKNKIAPILYVERKIENYLINNISKINNTFQVYFTVKNLNKCVSTYENLATTIGNSIFGDYLELTYIYNIAPNENQVIGLIINPTKNNNHLYFNFDDITFKSYIGLTTTNYKFTTNYLYNKYTLQEMLEQYGYIGSDNIYLTYTSNVTASAYTGTETYTFDINNISDADFFTPYTYIHVYTNGGLNNYKCLLINITGVTFTIITSPDMVSDTTAATQIRNITDIETISTMLNECYINIEGG